MTVRHAINAALAALAEWPDMEGVDQDAMGRAGKAIDALNLALLDLSDKPAAWLWKHPTANFGSPCVQPHLHGKTDDACTSDWEVKPLWTEPPSRVPMTIQERAYIRRMAEGGGQNAYPYREAIAFDQGMRAAEIAHGITGRP
jgi:hypothetical protein